MFAVFYNPNASVDKLRQDNIQNCIKGQARALLFKEFTDDAASARRRSAEMLQDEGETVAAANDLATARKYEELGERYVALTPKDCNNAYDPKD